MVILVKNYLLVIRMSECYLTQWGASWGMERVCKRGEIRKNCGNRWKKSEAPPATHERRERTTYLRRAGRDSIPYGQDGAVCFTDDFVSKVPGHVGRWVNVRRALQAQNDEIGFESVGSEQDLFTGDAVLDHKFRLDGHPGM
jgi:hypothetical protein